VAAVNPQTVMMPQTASLIGIQLVQRGKKLAMGYQANTAPLDSTSHHNESMLKSKCVAFRRFERVKVSSSPEGKARFYKSVWR